MFNFGNIIDKISTNLERVKTIGVLILVIMFVLSLVQNGCSNNELDKMVQQLTGLDIKNDILQKDISARDSVLKSKNEHILSLRDSLGKSNAKTIQLKREYGHLEAKYDNLSEELLKIPVDSSYKFLTKTAYPYNGNMIYPFNAPQVKGIHKTFLENKSLLSMNGNLINQKDELAHKITLQDSLSMVNTSAMAIMKENRADLEQVVENKDEEIKIKEKQLKKQKRKSIWQKIGIGALALLIGFAAGSG